MRYDYLLVIGPGRSGSTFLYENLKHHPGFAFLESKEAYYYRSPKQFKRVWSQRNAGNKAIVADIANLAYKDPLLSTGVEALKRSGHRLLLVVLFRRHRARAASMLRFRKSRGYWQAWISPRLLEDAVVRDRLQPEQLVNIYRLDVDVLTISFSTLTKHTATALDVLTSLCGTTPCLQTERHIVNESVSARNVLLSALGKLMAVALRKLGRRGLLQRLKDSDFVQGVFFVPLPDKRRDPQFRERNAALLDTSFCDCRSIIQQASEQIREGVYLRRAGSPLPVPQDTISGL